MTTTPTPKPWEHAKSGQGSATDPLAARFVASLSYDRRLYAHDIAGSIAHARMLHDIKLISTTELADIEKALAAVKREIEQQGDDWPGWKIDLEDVHMCIEAALIERIGDAGRKLHTGRSRNDQVALDLRLWIRDAVHELDGQFEALCAAFVTLARRDGKIVMPSYTHLQRAQPIVVGGELLAWVTAFDRARRRLKQGVIDLDENPLGSGAIAGSSLPLDRQRTSALLDMGQPASNSIDATASRDAAVDFVYALAMAAMTLSRWAEQWIIYASTEFGFLKLGEAHTTGSSMMPQKRNPDMLELIRGRCGGVYGHLVALLTILKGLPIGYNRDLQEDKRHVFEACDSVRDCLEMAARIVSSAHFVEERITAGLERGFLDATSLAEYLVVKGVPFRTAHQIVGAAVRQCEAAGKEKLSQLSVDDLNKACTDAGQTRAVSKDVYEWLGPANVVKRYQTSGNAGVQGFEQQLALWEKQAGRRKKSG